ncbi:hypothetical protein PGT21_020467 [Puccinia graminis f. sp. tritici]|uniref:Uncharacterized protein n=1 Tax=Puccinia graminis f. sp. tritici TaxID=56615 RepID=A0A5B0PJU2_PUCGR|nr:hypothetical protein PGT21_020467 [Puccinia graminis f. sp. tritici]
MRACIYSALLTLVQLHLVLAAIDKVIIDLDPPTTVDLDPPTIVDPVSERSTEPEKSSPVPLAESRLDNLPPLSCEKEEPLRVSPSPLPPLSFFPTSADSASKKTHISPEKPTSSGTVLPATKNHLGDCGYSSKKRKSLRIEQPASQGEAANPFHRSPAGNTSHACLSLSLDPQACEKVILAGPSRSTIEEQERNELAGSSKFEEMGKMITNKRLRFATPRSLNENQKALEYSNLAAFKPQGVKPKIWAWIWFIWANVEKTARKEVNIYMQNATSFLTSIYINQNKLNPSPNKDNLGETSGGNLQQNPMKAFVSLLWAVNIKALEYANIHQDSPYYIGEQMSCMNWFIWFMKQFKNPNLNFSLNHGKNYGHFITNEGGLVYQKILKAIDSKSQQLCYKIWNKENEGKNYLVSEVEILMSEAVVNFLGFYYKTTNHEKWKYVFGEEDIDFILKLEHSGRSGEEKPRWNYGSDLDLIPWQNPCTHQLPRISLTDSMIRVYDYTKYIEPIICMKLLTEIQNIGEIKPFQISHVFGLDNIDEDQLKSVSILKLEKNNTILPHGFEPTSEFIKSAQNIFLSMISLVSNMDDASQIFHRIEDPKFREKWYRIFEYMWEINGKLLQCLGCEMFEETFLKEQKLVQIFSESILTQIKPKKTEIETNLGDQYAINDHHMETLHNCIIDLFFLNQSKEIDPPKHSKDPNLKILQEDLTMTQISLILIGNYYKNQSFQKWSSIFGTDQVFFIFLTKLSNPEEFERIEREKYSMFKSMELLPWKN